MPMTADRFPHCHRCGRPALGRVLRYDERPVYDLPGAPVLVERYLCRDCEADARAWADSYAERSSAEWDQRFSARAWAALDGRGAPIAIGQRALAEPLEDQP